VSQATETATFGPIQMLVVGFEDGKFSGEILAELKRLKENDVIRMIDLLFVKKDESGSVEVLQSSDLGHDEAMEFGALVGALIGLGEGGEEGMEAAALAGAAELDDGHVFDDSDVWYVADAVPSGSSAAIALLEHRWAIPLRDKIVAAGGVSLADEWIHPADLIALGMAGGKAAATAGKAS
jgi:uncharacterized membrane protein